MRVGQTGQKLLSGVDARQQQRGKSLDASNNNNRGTKAWTLATMRKAQQRGNQAWMPNHQQEQQQRTVDPKTSASANNRFKCIAGKHVAKQAKKAHSKACSKARKKARIKSTGKIQCILTDAFIFKKTHSVGK